MTFRIVSSPPPTQLPSWSSERSTHARTRPSTLLNVSGTSAWNILTYAAQLPSRQIRMPRSGSECDAASIRNAILSNGMSFALGIMSAGQGEEAPTTSAPE